MRKNVLKRQDGMSLIGLLTVVFLIISFALIAMKLVPLYMRNHTIKSVMAGMTDAPGVTKMSTRKIKQSILRRLDINSIYEFDRKTLTVKKVKGYFELRAEYEVREPIVGNIDVVLSFKELTKIPIR